MAHLVERVSRSSKSKRAGRKTSRPRVRAERGFEIRESIRTEKGPRSRCLTSFTGTLTNRILDLAEARATQRFSREELIAQAHEKGIPYLESQADRDARRLLIDLRRNRKLDSNLVHLLIDELSQLQAKETPVDLEDAIEWLGTDAAERGSALRDLLRLSDRIIQSRSRPLNRGHASYPKLVARGKDAA